MEIVRISRQLQDLQRKIDFDDYIKFSITNIIDQCKDIDCRFSQIMKTDGNQVLLCTTSVISTVDLHEVSVKHLQRALEAFRQSLSFINADSNNLEKAVHVLIEYCRFRKKYYESEWSSNQTELSLTHEQFEIFDEDSHSFKEDADVVGRCANILEKKADELDKVSKTCKSTGLVCGILAGVGIVGAAVAGPLMLPIAAVVGAKAVINLNKSAKVGNAAKSLQENVKAVRNEADSLSSSREFVEYQKDELIQKSELIQERIRQYIDACTSLEVIEGALPSTLDANNYYLEVLQNIEVSVKDAHLHGITFEMLQRVFANHSGRYEARTQACFDDLKTRWQIIELLLRDFN